MCQIQNSLFVCVSDVIASLLTGLRSRPTPGRAKLQLCIFDGMPNDEKVHDGWVFIEIFNDRTRTPTRSPSPTTYCEPQLGAHACAHCGVHGEVSTGLYIYLCQPACSSELVTEACR